MRTFPKQPAEVVDYDLDYNDFFDERDDADQIVLMTITSDPTFGVGGGDLQLGPGSQPDWQLLPSRAGLNRIGKVWIGGGTDGEDYIVTFKVTTELGRLDEGEFRVRVRETP